MQPNVSVEEVKVFKEKAHPRYCLFVWPETAGFAPCSDLTHCLLGVSHAEEEKGAAPPASGGTGEGKRWRRCGCQVPVQISHGRKDAVAAGTIVIHAS